MGRFQQTYRGQGSGVLGARWGAVVPRGSKKMGKEGQQLKRKNWANERIRSTRRDLSLSDGHGGRAEGETEDAFRDRPAWGDKKAQDAPSARVWRAGLRGTISLGVPRLWQLLSHKLSYHSKAGPWNHFVGPVILCYNRMETKSDIKFINCFPLSINWLIEGKIHNPQLIGCSGSFCLTYWFGWVKKSHKLVIFLLPLACLFACFFFTIKTRFHDLAWVKNDFLGFPKNLP